MSKDTSINSYILNIKFFLILIEKCLYYPWLDLFFVETDYEQKITPLAITFNDF